MIAVTPQMLEPIASREVSFGGSLKILPSSVITLRLSTNSTNTSRRLMPPIFATSPNTNFAPTSTMPSFSQSS